MARPDEQLVQIQHARHLTGRERDDPAICPSIPVAIHTSPAAISFGETAGRRASAP
jgi:hypothetical protein